VRVGHAVRLTVEGDATAYQGRVVRLSPIVQEQNRTLLVEAEVPNPNAVLKPGAFARADIVTDGSQPIIRVPTASVVTFAGVEKLLVVRQGKIAEVRVTTGRRANDTVEIVAGLKPGESVVLQPGNLAPGQAVTAER
jgi:membrane fusion protein (multidrug efflux system)